MIEVNEKLGETNNSTELNDLISGKELVRRLHTSEKAISRKRERGILIEGKHWFRPPGFRIMYSWCAIEELIRQNGKPHTKTLDCPKDASDGLHDR